MDNLVFGDRTYIMGILNANKDSFVPRSRVSSRGSYMGRIEEMVEEGADIIDIGGESTRPGSVYVGAKEELERVVGIISEAVNVGVPISIDTYKVSVAKVALDLGAYMINDITGGRDPKMLELSKEYGSRIVLMYNDVGLNELPHAKRVFGESGEIVEEVLRGLERISSRALSYGVSRDNIILDPGIGFQNGLEDNLSILRNLGLFKELGYPLLVGASNKGFIGRVMSEEDPEKRLEGTLACTAVSAMQGVDIVRVHDVGPNVMVAKMVDGVYRY